MNSVLYTFGNTVGNFEPHICRLPGIAPAAVLGLCSPVSLAQTSRHGTQIRRMSDNAEISRVVCRK